MACCVPVNFRIRERIANAVACIETRLRRRRRRPLEAPVRNVNNQPKAVKNCASEEVVSVEVDSKKINGKARRKQEKRAENVAKQDVKIFRQQKGKQISPRLDNKDLRLALPKANICDTSAAILRSNDVKTHPETAEFACIPKDHKVSLRQVPLERNSRGPANLALKRSTTPKTRGAHCPKTTSISQQVRTLSETQAEGGIYPRKPTPENPALRTSKTQTLETNAHACTFKEVEFVRTERTIDEDFCNCPDLLGRGCSLSLSQSSCDSTPSSTPRPRVPASIMEPGIWYKPPPHKGLRPRQREAPCANTRDAMSGLYNKYPTIPRQWVPSIACQYELARNTALKEAEEQEEGEEETEWRA